MLSSAYCFHREDQSPAVIEWSQGTNSVGEFGFCHGIYICIFQCLFKANSMHIYLFYPVYTCFLLSAEKKASWCSDNAHQCHESHTDDSREYICPIFSYLIGPLSKSCILSKLCYVYVHYPCWIEIFCSLLADGNHLRVSENAIKICKTTLQIVSNATSKFLHVYMLLRSLVGNLTWQDSLLITFGAYSLL